MKYYIPNKEDLTVGTVIEMRQDQVLYIRNEEGFIVNAVPWDKNINEEDTDNHWVKMTLTEGDLKGEHCRSFGHNDRFNIFMYPVRKLIEE